MNQNGAKKVYAKEGKLDKSHDIFPKMHLMRKRIDGIKRNNNRKSSIFNHDIL